jgi:hypothetical protein
MRVGCGESIDGVFGLYNPCCEKLFIWILENILNLSFSSHKSINSIYFVEMYLYLLEVLYA